MSGRDSIAIGLSERRFRAVEVARVSHGVKIERVLCDSVPDAIDLEDVDAVGAWIGSRLVEEGFSRGGVTFAVPREHASLKRLTLPTIDEYELPEMVRLSMARELPFDPNEAVLDFIPVGQDGHETTVVVTAMQQHRIDRTQQIAKAARLRIDRIALRCMGIVRLLNANAEMGDEHNAVLGVDITSDTVEIAVLTGGHLRFSRAAKIANIENPIAFADAISTETRRSWMSYRIVEDAPDISLAYVFGDPAVTKHVAAAIEEFMKVKAECVEDHPHVDSNRNEMSTTWPLAGLLLETVQSDSAIDFLNPRHTPDRNARKRQIGIGVAGFLLLAAAVAFMFGFKDLRSLRAESKELAAAVQKQASGHYQYERDLQRLRHIERWGESHVDWMGHVATLAASLPDKSMVLLDQFHGGLRFNGVEYDSRTKEWSVDRDIVITLDGEASTQAIVDEFRRVFAEGDLYEITSGGADSQGGKRYPFPFKFTLRTKEESPTQDANRVEETNSVRVGRISERGSAL